MHLAKTLVIFTGAIHYRNQANDSDIIAHAGFVKEVQVWSQHFIKIVVIGFKSNDQPPSDCISYQTANVDVRFWGESQKTHGFIGKLRLIGQVPKYFAIAFQSIGDEDVAMARGPEAVGFIGALVAKLKGSVRFARYTGQWDAFPGESTFHKIEKWFYAYIYRAPVAIYGSSNPALPYLIPFITSSITFKEWKEAESKFAVREWIAPYKLLCVGRLSINKNVALALRVAHELINRGYPIELHIVGDGEQNSNLKQLARDLNLENNVVMHGHVSQQSLRPLYLSAHCLVHTSQSEGFPKVYLEAMTYGLPVVASPAGLSTLILNPPNYGFVCNELSVDEYSNRIAFLLDNPMEARNIGFAAYEHIFEAGYLLDSLTEYYRSFLEQYLLEIPNGN